MSVSPWLKSALHRISVKNSKKAVLAMGRPGAGKSKWVQAGSYTRSLLAQLEPCLTQQSTLHTLKPLNAPLTRATQSLTYTPYPTKSAQVELRSERV